MTAIDIYRAQYEEERNWHFDKWGKYHWAARRIFDLTTYDSSLDERFVKDILEVCKVILEKRNYEYIDNYKNYVKYILVCQVLNDFNWLTWGTSIRGAWFDVDQSRDILDELEWYSDKKYKIDKVPFTVDNLRALIEFMEEPCETVVEGEEE